MDVLADEDEADNVETLIQEVVDMADFTAEAEGPILTIKLLFTGLMSLIHIRTLLLPSGKTLVLTGGSMC